MSLSRKPVWLKANKLGAKRTNELTSQLRQLHLHTVCQSAQCPNKGECFERGTATFMILGDVCTRGCRFCAVDKTKPILPPDPAEPESIGQMAKDLSIRHLVLTTVTRDDLPDGGAAHFAQVIQEVKRQGHAALSIEVLISDLQGDLDALQIILDAKPDVLNHNLETVPRLYAEVRPQADYQRSLRILATARQRIPDIVTKSGIMVGLGETPEEVLQLMQDLRGVDCNILTIGQYLAPSREHYPVHEYIHPDVFTYYHDEGMKLGFQHVESGPLVRSSYHAEIARDYIKSI